MNKFTYIFIIFIVVMCLIISSMTAYLYYPKNNNININGIWISAGPETTKNTIVFTDNNQTTLQFRDTSNTLLTQPRQMNVTTRTPTRLDAEYNGTFGDVIKFTTSDGYIGIYSVQASPTSPILQYVYQKT